MHHFRSRGTAVAEDNPATPRFHQRPRYCNAAAVHLLPPRRGVVPGMPSACLFFSPSGLGLSSSAAAN